ncbi:expressed unknown protein [Seminavis robusta]|uniref:Uncharacterized protein n=1 Tax=Seminavis robusta TaxID=568900 RepID=A0A9N8DI22_9STRA|nr:expressed unknown protein [Seminavis robusta]|eukprot:Sro138_g064820.1 n/a (257) ;mRNA; f:78209-78979
MARYIQKRHYVVRFYCQGSDTVVHYPTLAEGFRAVLEASEVSFQNEWFGRLPDVHVLNGRDEDDEDEDDEDESCHHSESEEEEEEEGGESCYSGNEEESCDSSEDAELDDEEASTTSTTATATTESAPTSCESRFCCCRGEQLNDPAPLLLLYKLPSGRFYCGACLDRDLGLALRFAPGRVNQAYYYMDWGWDEHEHASEQFQDSQEDDSGTNTEIVGGNYWPLLLWTWAPYANQDLFFVGLNEGATTGVGVREPL